MSSQRQKDEKGHGSSELFTIRLWIEELGGEAVDYRGQVKHVVSGATRNFRDWSDLHAFLIGTLNEHRGRARGQDDDR